MGIIGAGIKIGNVMFPNIGAVIQAYQPIRKYTFYSTPQLMTLDNEEAEIMLAPMCLTLLGRIKHRWVLLPPQTTQTTVIMNTRM